MYILFNPIYAKYYFTIISSIINVQIINEIVCILPPSSSSFRTKSLKARVFFTLTAHLHSESPRFTYSVGSWG